MNIQEITDVRGFRVPLSFEDNQYVDIYVSPNEDKTGFILDHMVMESGYGIDFSDDEEIVIQIAREIDQTFNPYESEENEEDVDIFEIILSSLPL